LGEDTDVRAPASASVPPLDSDAAHYEMEEVDEDVASACGFTMRRRGSERSASNDSARSSVGRCRLTL